MGRNERLERSTRSKKKKKVHKQEINSLLGKKNREKKGGRNNKKEHLNNNKFPETELYPNKRERREGKSMRGEGDLGEWEVIKTSTFWL